MISRCFRFFLFLPLLLLVTAPAWPARPRRLS